jgi:hypothetical protein
VFNGRSPENLPLSALAFLHSIKSSLLIGWVNGSHWASWKLPKRNQDDS